MRILFDNGVPKPLRRHLPGHYVRTAFECGWAKLENGDLLNAAQDDFDVLITTDSNLQY
jgi:predicted nuclease of predicted toxin-antitoxin system